jgi:hypothetical protein
MPTEFDIAVPSKLAEFITSKNSIDIIQGPLGSGKTYALCLRIMRHAQEQVKSPLDGIRHTKFAIVRNTFPDLRRTVMDTWLRLFPEQIYGRFVSGAVMEHRIRFGDVECTVHFLSLDKDEDVRKLRSGEYTGIAFNELSFMIRELFNEARSRIRFPPPEHGGPNPWGGVIADTNAPDEDHWLAIMTGQVELPPGLTADERASYVWPPSWGHYMQPPALIEQRGADGTVIGYKINPQAENLQNLPPGYYNNQIIAQEKSWIDSRLMNRIALVIDGSPVWPMFNVETHIAREALRPVQGHDVIIGVDFGRTAGVVFMQMIGNRIFVQYELVWQNQSTSEIAPKVKKFLAQHYPGYSYRAYGDPKGNDKGVNDGRTGYEIYMANGIKIDAPPGLKQNMIATRVDAVASVLNEMESGRPRFLLSPICRTLKIAMAGRYHNERDDEGELKPSKDRYSHIADALQYACLGLGEGRRMIGLKPLSEMVPMRVWHGRKSMRRVTA